MATGLGVVLAAGLVLAIADVVHTGGALLPVLALWAIVASPVAVGVGIVLGAGNATWGQGWVRRTFAALRDDEQLDKRSAALLIAGAVLAGVIAILVSKLAVPLVGNVERKSVGGLLLGVAVVGVLPIVALGTLPLYRVTHRIAGVLPAIGPFARTVVLVVAGVALAVVAALYVIYTKLDYQVLPLSFLYALALFPVTAIVLAALFYGPLAGLREKIPARGIVALVGLVIAGALPVVGLGTPSEATRTAVIDRSYLGSKMVGILRKLIDKDKDGHSAFFGGPDCDDNNKDVYPGAPEIPNNGIDDNCVGGDSKGEQVADTPPATPPATPGTATPAVEAGKGLGGKNLLIIFVDTLRYDRLGFTGYKRDGNNLTPRIDAFAKESVVFTKAFAQAPNTPRSVPSMMASRYPSQVKYDKQKKSYGKVLDENDLLFETLKAGGFNTIGMSSHFYFCDRGRYPADCPKVPDWMNTNVWQGTDLWDNAGALQIHKEGEPNSNNDKAGPRIVEKTTKKLEELAKANTKFAMLVHLFEPHSTYMAYDEFPIQGTGDQRPAKYDYEIAMTDRYIGQLLDSVDKLGLAKDTTVVLVSDHGEAFGVHTFAGEKMWYHGQTLYTELLHVPLIIRAPGVTPRMANDVVEMIDVAPTVASLFGLPAPASWRGRSLLPVIEGKELPAKPAYAELLPEPKWDHDAKSMITGDGKRHVFFRISDAKWEIYDLDADPEERKDLAGSDADAAKLKEQLAGWMEGSLAAGAK